MKALQNPQFSITPQYAQQKSDEGGLNVGQVLGAIRRQRLLIAGMTILLGAGTTLKAFYDTPIYQGKFELLTKPVSLETQIISTTNPDSLSNREELIAVTVDDVKLKVLKSPTVLSPILEQLRSQYPQMTYQSLVSNLSIKTLGSNADILEVVYESTEPAIVNTTLELISQAYLQYSLEERQSGIRQGIDFVEDQLPQLRQRVSAQQQRLQELRQEYNLIDPEIQGQQLSSQIASVIQQQMNTQVQLDEVRAINQNLRQEIGQSTIESAAASILKEDSRYQSFLEQIRDLDRDLAKESVLFLDNSPEINILREQRQNLVSLLQQEAQQVQRNVGSQIRELEVRDQVLNDTVQRLNRQVKDLSLVTRQYTDIQRELDIATRNLDQFLAKREALRIDVAQQAIPWELLVLPTEPERSVTSIKNNLLLGTMVGFLLGTVLGLLNDKLQNILYTSDEVKHLTKLPILGVIPFQKDLMSAIPTINITDWLQHTSLALDLSVEKPLPPSPTSPFLEAFRFIHTNLCLINPDQTVQSVVVSSAIAGEGKSTVSIHLAQAAAALGKRVLLVDTDLRRPQVHHRLGLNNHRGLIDVISTENLEFENTIQRSFLEKNLYVLTSGFVPADPLKLLASLRMKQLITKLQTAFDLVIFDAPPILGFTDAALLSAYTDGMIWVVGLEKVKRSLLQQGLEDLKISGISLLGAIANGSKEIQLTPTDYSFETKSAYPLERQFSNLRNRVSREDNNKKSAFFPKKPGV